MDQLSEHPDKLPDLHTLWELNHLKKDYQENISFQELLIVGKFNPNESTPTPVGAMCLNIIQAINDPQRQVVYLRSAFDIDGRKAGSKIIAWLFPELHTIKEKRYEFMEYCKSEECTEPYIKQTLYFAAQKDHIYIHHSQEGCNMMPSDNTKSLPFEFTQTLVGEGANFALMRVLAQNKYIGQFEVSTLYINGDLCRNQYLCTGPESGMVNNKKMDVCKIYRRIIEQCGIVHACSTVLTVTGRIITHEWRDCDYVVYLNPLVDLAPTMFGLDSEPIERLDCFTDLQLYSNYLEKKELCSSQMKKYVKNRPDIQSVLADYVQTVLQMKPADSIKFTMEYFSRFSENK